jgi:general secretion pathway protein E
VTRLRDMGVEPFLLSSSLSGVIAQRLVRKLCPDCKRPYVASRTDCEALGIKPGKAPTLYAATGCDSCSGIGYRGRTGIYEVVAVDEQLRDMIHDGASEHEMEQHARTHTPGIREEGLRQVLAGHTSLEEVLRVTRED